MTPPPFVFERAARSTTTALVLLGVWAALLAAWVWLEAAGWIIGLLGLFTLPAVFDLSRNPQSGLQLDARTLRWHSGRRSAEVTLEEIAHIRLDTRLDFSVRASVVLRTGRTVRLPFESTPPHQAFEDALNARGVKTMRFHFQLLQ